jgi:hypothetical protein
MSTITIPNQLFREGTSNVEDGVVRLSISSNEPQLRCDWSDDGDGTPYWEILDHSNDAIDLSRLRSGAAVLFNHHRDVQLGTAFDPEVRQGRCYIAARLSNAPDVASYKTRIEEGILKDVSIGYEVTDSGVYVGTKSGIPMYRFKFAINEVSFVTIPSDISVGLGRSRSEEPKCGLKKIEIGQENNVDLTQASCNKPSMPTETEVTETPVETPAPIETHAPAVAETPTETHTETPAPAAVVETPVETPAPESPVVAGTEQVRELATNHERTRVVLIQKWANDISRLRGLDLREQVTRHIEDGSSLLRFKEWVLENEFKTKPTAFSSETSTANTLSRSAFNALPANEQSAHCVSGGRIKD